MHLKFHLTPVKFTTIQELPNAWNDQKYKELLVRMEFEDLASIASNEVKEMCLLALTDFEPGEAARLVLGYVFGKRLNEGQINNVSNEMLDEKMWEEYADLSLHEEFFNVHQLLYEAFNGKFPPPEAVRFEVRVRAEKPEAMALLETQTEAHILRLLVQGMPDNTLIKRLFKEKLNKGEFKEAKDILWQLQKTDTDDTTFTVSLISSLYWFRDIKFVEAYDAMLEDDE